ncbi:MAG: TOBE domain-containing protein, partial [Kiloniellales bacterium]|nr:TOBE domain-containing protein [Kiloniellales bacterium]
QVDSPEALYDRPRTRFVAEFIGQSNLFAVKPGAAAQRAAVPELGIEIPVDLTAAVAISLRPERVRPVSGQEPDGCAVFEGRVEDQTFFGPVVAQSVRLASGRVMEIRSQRSGHDRLPATGEVVRLAFDPADAVPLVAE